jgi:hypothetical protein
MSRSANMAHFGYWRLTVLLRREGWRIATKRVYRLQTEDGQADAD